MTKADWLRSEIEKLEKSRKTKIYKDRITGQNVEHVWNDALTSIITRYKDELNVLTGE